MQTSSRMFLAKKLPFLEDKLVTHSIRYYLYRSENIVLRVQSENNTFQLERKEDKSNLVRNKDRVEITKEEFDLLKTLAKDSIIRDNYVISEHPQVKLHVYHGRFEGLNRIEAKFTSLEKANEFIPYNWFDKEITNSPLGRDNMLLELSQEEFKKLLVE